MKTIITLDKANIPYGFPQLNSNGNFNNLVVEGGLTAYTLTLSNLTQNFSNVNLLSVDNTGVVSKYFLSGITEEWKNAIGNYLPLSGGTVTGATIFNSGLSATSLSATSLSATTYQNLPLYLSAATQSSANTLTIRNSTGGTFNYIPNAVTGGTFASGTLTLSGTGSVNGVQITGFGAGTAFTGGTVSGATSFISGLTANTISATTYQNLPNNIYTGNDTLISNRTVNLSSFTLSFSSVTQPNTLSLSSGNVGIGKTPSYKLDVNGDINFPTTTGSTYGVINQNGNRILHTYGTTNLFLGISSGNFTTSGSGNNIGIGSSTLSFLTTGSNNIAIGSSVLNSLTSGSGNIGIGRTSLLSNTIGANNIAIGENSLSDNISGQGNIAIGIGALSNNTTPNSNIGIGLNSLISNVTSPNNTAVGYRSGYSTVSGSGNNVIVGYESLYNNITGSSNVTIGYRAGYNETGSNKLYIANNQNSTLIYGEFNNGRVGINTTAVTNALTVSAVTNPLKLINVQTASNNEFLNIDTTGVVSKIALSAANITVSGLTANTISATTYLNLPIDVHTTGASYSNNTFTFINNTGGTYSALFNTVTGLTVNGNLTVTGNTLVQSTTATTLYTNYIDFNTGATVAGQVGRLKWNDTDGTLDLGLKGGSVTLQIGQEQVVRAVNKTGADLLESEYKVVRIRKTSEGGAQGQRLALVLAQADNDDNSVDTMGLVTENILDNEAGFITTFGLVNNIDTRGILQGETWNEGDVLYVSPTTAGQITNIKPQAPNHTIIVGFVVYKHQNNGKIFVKVDNGYEINELHNVKITNPQDNDILQYSASTSIWYNTNSPRLNGLTASTLSAKTLNVGNLTNNFIPVNSGGTFNDSFLYQSGTTFKSIYSGNTAGFDLDFQNNVYSFGDYQLSKSFILISNGEISASEIFNGSNGLTVNPSTGDLNLGNFSNNELSFLINSSNKYIRSTLSGDSWGINLDYILKEYSIGDLSNTVDGNRTKIIINDGNRSIILTNVTASTDTDLVTINSSGVLKKRSINQLPFVSAVTLSSENVLSVISAGSADTKTTINAVTGGTYNNGTITLSGTGNVNGVQITGFSTSTATAFTGGTVSGQTNFTNGLTANSLVVSAITDPVRFVGLQPASDTSILTVDGTGVIHTISSSSLGLTWNNATANITASTNNGYVGTASSLTTITLPTSATFGTIIEVVGTGTGLWRVSQNASQSIKFGVVSTTTGTGGYLSATSQYDCVKLLCTSANTTFVVTSAVGNIFYN